MWKQCNVFCQTALTSYTIVADFQGKHLQTKQYNIHGNNALLLI